MALKKFRLKFNTKLRILLWKTYFDKGFGLTNNLKYIVGLFALYEVVQLSSLKTTIIAGIIWVIACFFIGWWWIRNAWNTAQLEIENRINPFMAEVRQGLGIPKPKNLYIEEDM